jgi:hypothetical protein
MKRHWVLLAAVCVTFVSCGKGQNTLVVINHSGMTADQIAVTVCEKDHLISNLKNGDSATREFSIRGDSGVAVSVLLSDGSTMTNGFGYVTGGAGANGNRIEIEITEDGRIVGKQE